MKNNLIIKFDIDVDVKILLDNDIIGESGYKDTFKTTIEKDGLLTIKHGMKKANIRVSKEKLNNICVTYSTSGQLKATFIVDASSSKKEEEKSKENPTNNISVNDTSMNAEVQNDNNVVVGIITFVVLVAIIWGSISFFTNSLNTSEASKKINGCYYITNHLYEGRGTKLCINKSTVAFTVEGSTVNLYPNYVGDVLYIENEYGDTLFRCTASKENSNNIQCDSYNKAIGSGTNIWKIN